MRRKLTWYTALATLAVCILATLVWRYLYQPIASFNLGKGRHISIWSEWIFHDTGVRQMMCEIRDANGALGLPRYLGGDWGKPLEFRLAFADDKNLACVWSPKPGSPDLYMIIYDAQSRDCYTLYYQDDTMRMPHVRKRWMERYARLRAANLELPEVWSLTEESWAGHK